MPVLYKILGKFFDLLEILYMLLPFIVYIVLDAKFRRKEELWRKAIRIVKHFGDCEYLALYRFNDLSRDLPRDEKRFYWVLIEYGDKYRKYESIREALSHGKYNYYIVGDTIFDYEIEKKETKEVNKICYLLPYKVFVYDAPMSFHQYRERVRQCEETALDKKL